MARVPPSGPGNVFDQSKDNGGLSEAERASYGASATVR
jgi:hypothetical protein